MARGAARGAQSRGSATAERHPGCVLGAGVCGAPGACVGQLSAKEEPVRHACSEEASWAWEQGGARVAVAEGVAVGSEAAEGTVRVRVRVEAAPMTTGVLALKTMNVSTLQYCSVLMFVNIHARKATDTQKKLWCSAGAHE